MKNISALWRCVIKVSTISVVTKSIIFTIFLNDVGFTTTLITIFFNSTDNILDTKKHACGLYWCLKFLEFNCYWIPNFFFLHVCNFSGITVNSIHKASFNGVFCFYFCNSSYNIWTPVCGNVLGLTFNVLARALYGHYYTPVTV